MDNEHAADIVTDARVKAHFPDTIANILSNHTKAVHDSLALDISSLTLDIACRAYKANAQVIPDGAITKILYNAENFDVGGNFDADGADSNFTVPAGEAGFYHINALCGFIDLINDQSIKISIYVDGVIKASNSRFVRVGTQNIQVSALLDLAVGEVVDIRVTQNAGAGKNVSQSSSTNYVEIFKLGT